MVISRGLVISLSISALGCTLLFLYFRNKISSMEKKVDVMFDLIQNHQQGQDNISVLNSREENHIMQSNNNFDENIQNNLGLISVSEDESDNGSDNGSDSEEISDSDEDMGDDEGLPKISLNLTEDMTLEVNDVKKITVQETTTLSMVNSIKMEDIEDITDSLDEMDDTDNDEEDDTEGKGVNEAKESDGAKESSGAKESGETKETKEIVVEKIDDVFDYNKLRVSELKSFAKQRGLQNYKSLKKGSLIDLLKSQE